MGGYRVSRGAGADMVLVEEDKMNKTKIEYLTHTWSPIAMRCTPVSEGCAKCIKIIPLAKQHTIGEKGGLPN